jgi:hypothetical protein
MLDRSKPSTAGQLLQQLRCATATRLKSASRFIHSFAAHIAAYIRPCAMLIAPGNFPFLILLLGGLSLAANAQSPAGGPKSIERVRHIIFQSRNLGASALQGSWIATAGPSRFLRGRWSAQVLPDTKNAASGSWALLSESNQVILEGTWSAQKSTKGWRGTWSARIQKSRTVSGTWDAAMADFNGKTFEDMLKRAAEKQIGGSWQSGPAHGNWWLQH